MKLSPARGLAAALTLTALAAASTTVHAQTETWSTVGDARGWSSFVIGGSEVLAHDGVGALSFGADDYALFYALADSAASNGMFTGSYAGYTSLRFDLALDAASIVEEFAVRLFDADSGHEWTYALSLTPGAAASFLVPLDASALGWTQQAGPSADFSALLASVDELSFVFVAYGLETSFAATLDNVALTAIPEPAATAVLAGLAAFAGVVALRRHHRRPAR